jgi:ribonuclease HI
MKVENRDIVTINTDASYDCINKTGGYGIWIKSNYFTIKKAGRFKSEILDANEAEIKAVINALHILITNERKFQLVVINCDNQTVRNIIINKSIPKRFEKEGIILLELMQSFKIIRAKRIKGHQNDYNSRQFVNNWCDKASREYKRKK